MCDDTDIWQRGWMTVKLASLYLLPPPVVLALYVARGMYLELIRNIFCIICKSTSEYKNGVNRNK